MNFTVYAFFTLVYLDRDMNMFKDPEKNTPYPGPLYQKEADPTTYYLNDDLTVTINMVEDEDLKTKLGETTIKTMNDKQ